MVREANTTSGPLLFPASGLPRLFSVGEQKHATPCNTYLKSCYQSISFLSRLFLPSPMAFGSLFNAFGDVQNTTRSGCLAAPLPCPSAQMAFDELVSCVTGGHRTIEPTLVGREDWQGSRGWGERLESWRRGEITIELFFGREWLLSEQVLACGN